METSGAFTTAPYVFSSTQRGGVTIAAATPSQQGVLGFDIQLDTLNRFFESLLWVGSYRRGQRCRMAAFSLVPPFNLPVRLAADGRYFPFMPRHRSCKPA